MIDLNAPTTLEEIALALGISKEAARKKAKGWSYSEKQMHGKNKLRLYALKDIPNSAASLVNRLIDYRIQQRELHERTKNIDSAATDANSRNGGGLRVHPIQPKRDTAQADVLSGDRAGQPLADCEHGRRNECGGTDIVSQGDDGAVPTGRVGVNQANGQRRVDTDRARVVGNQLLDVDATRLDTGSVAKSEITTDTGLVEIVPGVFGNQKQLDVHRARQNLIDYLRGGKGPMSKRIAALNAGYHNGILSATLTWSFEHAWEKRRANTQLTAKTYENWCKDFAARGHYAPLKRQKDFSIKPWHPVALALRQRPQGSSKQWVYNQLVEQLGEDALPDYTNVCRWLNDKASQSDQDKGRYSGSQLRARRFYQHRTAEGLAPASLMHADGWNSHFTAPHPVTGEFVTYEIWHAHDVATRYVPQPGIGLTENWQVILKCVENFVRELGIPARVQTDSTKVVKGSDRFTKAVHSLEERLGMTWTHPVTVGNSQANGIAENFNTSYLDKRSRELATYQNKNSMDELSFKRIRKLTHDMVKAAGAGNLIERDKIKHQIEKIGKGLVFESYDQAIAWIAQIFNDYNDRPHAALPRVVDAVTGKRRHQTPREALLEHIAHGWEPVALAEHELIAEFRPHVTVTIRRDTVTPWGGMRYYHPVLATMNDKPVIVAYDLADYHHVWVKDLDGTPICTADFVEATRYHAMSAQMAEEEKRAQAALKRLDKKRDAVIERMPGEVLTLESIPANQIAGLETIAKKIEIRQENPVEMAPTIPQDDREKYWFYCSWKEKAATGEGVPEALQPFMQSYPKTAKYRAMDKFYNPSLNVPDNSDTPAIRGGRNS